MKSDSISEKVLKSFPFTTVFIAIIAFTLKPEMAGLDHCFKISGDRV
jgi:hypothetical protein